ncbi:MAG: glutathione peroxidase, partial [Planctomycetota bacterium]|nr:glutathione peroxidase [Planctomycetota bacterium]
KVRIKSDEQRSPVYALLGTQTGKLPGWNFSKYVVGRDGRAVEFFGSTVTPSSPKIAASIDKAMAQPPSTSG